VLLVHKYVTSLYGDKLNPQGKGKKSPNDYLPNLAGRWKNMLVMAPKDQAQRKTAIKFMEQVEEAFSKVRFRKFQFISF
jgi:hypothetical protein